MRCWIRARNTPPRCSKPSTARCQVVSCVRVHQHIIPGDIGIPSPAVRGLSGRGYADFPVGVNFAGTEFSEGRTLHGPGPLQQ
jgi:hypothetical protein